MDIYNRQLLILLMISIIGQETYFKKLVLKTACFLRLV